MMNTKEIIIKTLSIVASIGLIAGSLTADTVVTKDGAQLTGTITKIDAGMIYMNTDYAGTLEIDQSKVASFSTVNPVFVRLASGSTMSGPVELTGNGTLKIASEDGTLETDMDRVVASWGPDTEDPKLTKLRASKEALQRKWKYQGGLDLLGQTGNNEEFTVGLNLEAKLKGPQDELAFFAEYENRETNGITAEDRIAGGVSYESFFSEHYGWYARTELEKDDADRIDFRSTSAVGASFRVINKDYQTLVLRSGLGYRNTTFSNATPNESSATLDFGLNHMYRHNDVFVMNNKLTFVPSIDDFAQYRIVHDSGIEVPVGSSQNWKMRFGIKNEFDSEPAANEKLDTTYYTRMIYAWD